MLRIARLAEQAGALAVLSSGYETEWPDWYREAGQARRDLEARMNRDRLPLALVALDGTAPVGTLAISDQDTYGDPEFRPTVIGLWVAPAWRRRGIASQLLRAACGEARTLGFSTLHAATSSAGPLFAGRNWEFLGEADWSNEPLRLFRVVL
jgi:GNAT superfamily N-acetyltransferase